MNMERKRKYKEISIIKYEPRKNAVSILNVDFKNNLWLVEWNDKSRTWEKFNVVKNFDFFESFIMFHLKPKEYPTYIC